MFDRSSLVTLALAFVGVASAAVAAEYPVADATVSLKVGDPLKRSLSIRGEWAGELAEASPVLDGATLRVAGAYGEGGTDVLALVGAAWRTLPNGRGFKYVDRDGSAGGIRSILLRPGRNGHPGMIKISGKNLDYDYRDTHSILRASLEIGLDRWCVEVPVTGDDGSRVEGQGVAAPVDCPSDIVVEVHWLEARLAHPDVQVIDTRSTFSGGHIPGALPLRPEQLATTIEGIDYQMMPPELAGPVLSGLGLRRDATAVVVGVSPEFDAARVTWALHYLGHPDVRYLDGGWNAWVAAGGETMTGSPVAGTATTYVADPLRPDVRTTGDVVLAQIGAPPYDAPTAQLVDARSNGEFMTGHIPSATFRPWTDNFSSGRLKARADLEDLYTGLGLDPARTTVTYCLVGWRASVSWLALKWLGFEDVRIYDGSWTEWGAGGFPVETGS